MFVYRQGVTPQVVKEGSKKVERTVLLVKKLKV